MGLDSIPSRTDGQTIVADWFNLIQRVMSGNLTPRSAGTVGPNLGSLGDTTNYWTSVIAAQLQLWSNSKQISILPPSGLAANYGLTLPGALPSVQSAIQCSPSGILSFVTPPTLYSQTFTTSASFSPVAGVTTYIVLGCGGGGGGGGGTTNGLLGAGGTAAPLSIGVLTGITTSQTYTAGTAGAGNLGASGSNGGATSFGALSFPGGLGGISMMFPTQQPGWPGQPSAFGAGGAGGNPAGGTATGRGAGGGGGGNSSVGTTSGGSGVAGQAIVFWVV